MENWIKNNNKLLKFSFFALWICNIIILYLNMENKEGQLVKQISGLEISQQQIGLFKILTLVINTIMTAILIIIIYMILRWIFFKFYDKEDKKIVFSSMFFLNVGTKFLLFLMTSTLNNLFNVSSKNLSVINAILFFIFSLILNTVIFKRLKIRKFYMLAIAFLVCLII